ncbi:MAG: asparaginase [Prevotellaceae bacterium]|jgi:L-asparaginase|nr:asparaginase [Prevotellaceae bacterium]
MQHAILIIYTGGTIGMKLDPATGALQPFNFEQVEQEVPELRKFAFRIDTLSLTPIDSSEVNPDVWVQLATTIAAHYEAYDGFVVLHGTDTMAYTASALSFMLENLGKPVVLTGSQLPIGMIRTDGKENLISAIEVAAAKRLDGLAHVPEVCIFFGNELLRGNRTTKYNADHFQAFRSANYPSLAKAGIHIAYNEKHIAEHTEKPLKLHGALDANIAILKIFPGMTEAYAQSILGLHGLRAVIMEAYGSGNAPTPPWFLQLLKETVMRGVIVLNVTQCLAGSVNMNTYEGGRMLLRSGVQSGHDITTEAALAKLMHLAGRRYDNQDIRHYLNMSLRGEISKP